MTTNNTWRHFHLPKGKHNYCVLLINYRSTFKRCFFIIFSIAFPPHFNYNCTALQNMNYYCVNNKQQNVKRKFHQISIKTCRELD